MTQSALQYCLLSVHSGSACCLLVNCAALRSCAASARVSVQALFGRCGRFELMIPAALALQHALCVANFQVQVFLQQHLEPLLDCVDMLRGATGPRPGARTPALPPSRRRQPAAPQRDAHGAPEQCRARRRGWHQGEPRAARLPSRARPGGGQRARADQAQVRPWLFARCGCC